METTKETAAQIFSIFLRLGCISFGGPTAHLAYFQEAFVTKRNWVSDAQYADLIALCQFLPGPASSQVGLSLGYLRGGKLGALAAWAGFTLPSAALMIAFVFGLAYFTVPDGALAGLKVVAVAVVAKALWAMTKKLCPDWPRRLLAIIAAGLILLGTTFSLSVFVIQLGLILLAGLVGSIIFKPQALPPTEQFAHKKQPIWLILFFILFVILPLMAVWFPEAALVDVMYRTGALVFGGGHVVLPIMEAQVSARSWMDPDTFMAGYGAAQALPGPLFAFSAFIGGQSFGLGGAIVALVMIYLPSFLLIFGIMPYWAQISQNAKIRAALMGINAAVVGILLAALYNPVWTSAMHGPKHIALGVTALAALTLGKFPPWFVVIACGLLGMFIL